MNIILFQADFKKKIKFCVLLKVLTKVVHLLLFFFQFKIVQLMMILSIFLQNVLYMIHPKLRV